MATNPNVNIDRNKYIGGSEISTILGINKFNNRFNLLLQKADLLENNFEGNVYTEFGDKFEPIIRDYINQFEEDKFIEDTEIVEREIISNRCNYDGKNKTTALEIKTTSIIHDTVREYDYYLVQLLWGMMLSNLEYGKLVVYHREDLEEEFNSDKLQIFDINIKDYQDLVDLIVQETERFRLDLQKVKDNPLITEEELMPKDLITISNKISLLENQIKLYEKIVKERDLLKENLYKAMKENNVKKWTTNNGYQITLVADGQDKEVEVISYDIDKFKEEHSDLVIKYEELKEKYKITKTEIKKGKKGYVKITEPKSDKNE